MTPDAPTDDRLAELRRRWEADPTTRLFLQLAEEYRKAERHEEAVEVLTKGLEEHPNQVSALVALGRNRLALGQPAEAARALEKAVSMDATNLAAMKLSVEAYLQQGDRDNARQRLELYRLLNDGDEEIEELERRLASRATPPPPPPAGAEDTAAAAETAEPAAGPQQVPEAPAAPSTPDTWSPTKAWPALPGDEAQAGGEDDEEPFAGLVSAAERDLYLAGLRSEGLFPFAGEDEPDEEAAPDPTEPRTSEERPTVTLGNLYLDQGHYGEAENIFQALLRADPDNAAARTGLMRARAGAEEETTEDPGTAEAPAAAATPAVPTGEPSQEAEGGRETGAAAPAFEVRSLAGLESAAGETAASERAPGAASPQLSESRPGYTLTAERLLADADPSLPPRVGLLRAYLQRIRNPS